MRWFSLVLLIAFAAPAPVVAAESTSTCARKKKNKKRKKWRKKRKAAQKKAPEPAAAVPEKAPTARPAASEAPAGPSLRRSTRIEFDARLVRGEKASGAVYLFHRSPRRFPSLVDLRRGYLERITRPVLRRGPDAAAKRKAAKKTPKKTPKKKKKK